MPAELITGKNGGYASRGWPTYESCASELIKDRVAGVHGWHMAVFINSTVLERQIPMAPDMFDALIRTKDFTNGADVKIVSELYAKNCTSILSTVLAITLGAHNGGVRMREGGPERLLASLKLCDRVETLDLVAMRITDSHISRR